MDSTSEPARTPAAPPPKPALGFQLNPVFLLPGLVASVFLLVDYTKGAPVFCTDTSGGCAALRRTASSYLGSTLPLPAIGIAGFTVLLVLGVLAGRLWRRLHAGVGLFALLAGIALFGIQVAKGKYCQFCLVADASAVAAGLVGALRWPLEWDPPANLRPRVGRLVTVLGVTSVIALIAFNKSVPVPAIVQSELGKTPRDKVLVMDFLDFECPFCRASHMLNMRYFAEHKDELRIVRYHVPLAVHPHAEPAARAALCGERLGHGEEMIERIFQIDPSEMSAARFTQSAVELGIDREAFASCLTDPSLRERLEKDREAWKATGAEGLPTMYVGTQRFVGAAEPPAVHAAFEAAKAR